jgi:hypothetical protein
MIHLHFTALGLQAVAVLMGAIFTTAFRVKNEHLEVNLKQLKSAKIAARFSSFHHFLDTTVSSLFGQLFNSVDK